MKVVYGRLVYAAFTP
nr:hypothetical protein [Vibrio vulnificus]